ncbi:MAG: hypothetical protein ACQESR_28495, partial [Planctomycetota bacterium]
MKWNILVGSLVLSLGLSTQSFGANLLDRMLGANYNGDRDTATCCETSVVEPSCGVDVVDDCCVPSAKRCRKTPLLDMLRGLRRDDCCDTCGEVVCDEDPCCEPTCGYEDPCGDVACEDCSVKCRKRPLLDMLRGLRRNVGCDRCGEPTCGVEDPCCEPTCGVEDPCAAVSECCAPKRKRPGLALLKRIFGGRKKAACCEPVCGVEPCREPTCGYDPSCGFEMSEPAEAEPTEAKEPKAEDGEDDEVGPAPVVDPTAFLPTER